MISSDGVDTPVIRRRQPTQPIPEPRCTVCERRQLSCVVNCPENHTSCYPCQLAMFDTGVFTCIVCRPRHSVITQCRVNGVDVMPRPRLPPSPPSSSSDDDQKEGWPEVDEEYVPGIDAPVERSASPDIPITNLRVTRNLRVPQSTASTVAPRAAARSTVAPLVIPEPTPEASAIYQRIQNQFDAIEEAYAQLYSLIDPSNLATFGETKEDRMPNISNMNDFTASLTTAANKLADKAETRHRCLNRDRTAVTKIASGNHARRVQETTVREQERVRNQVNELNERMQRDKEERDRLLASLPSNPRPTRRQRRQ